MFLYGITFSVMLIWLFLRLDTYDSQVKELSKAVTEIDTEKVYDCYFKYATGDLEPDGDEFKQFFCDKNQTKWDLI